MLERIYGSIPAIVAVGDDEYDVTLRISDDGDIDNDQTVLKYKDPDGRVVTLYIGWASSEILETALRVARPRRR